MKYRDSLRQILLRTRPHWDRDETRAAVRLGFRRTLQCRTAELGGAVYASPMAFAVDEKEYIAIAAGSSLYTFALP